PDGFALCGFRPIIGCDLYPAECEPRTELATLGHRSIAPRDAAERLAPEPRGDRARVLGVGNPTFACVESPHLLRRHDADCVVEVMISDRAAEPIGSTIPAIGEYDAARNSVRNGAIDHQQRQIF